MPHSQLRPRHHRSPKHRLCWGYQLPLPSGPPPACAVSAQRPQLTCWKEGGVCPPSHILTPPVGGTYGDVLSSFLQLPAPVSILWHIHKGQPHSCTKKPEVKNRAHPSTHLATLHMAALQSLFPLHIKSEGGSSSKSIDRLIKYLYSATLQSLLFSPSVCAGGLCLPCPDQSL